MKRALLIFACAALFWPMVAVAAEAGLGPVKHVLVVFSYHRGMTWVDAVYKGLEDTFAAQLGDGVELHVEFLDSKRYPELRGEDFRYRFFFDKYRNASFDSIVVCDDNALDFILSLRAELFPDVPMVFCGINYYDPQRFSQIANITGVVEAYDVARTLKVALGLHPETERLFIVNDLTTTGRANHLTIDPILAQFSPKITWQYLEGLSVEELQAELARLPERSIILLMSYNLDRLGRVLRYRDAIRIVRQASARPIYGVWGFYLGRGIVGGMLVTGEGQGSTAAELSLRVMSGEPADSIGVVTTSPNELKFDYRELQRFAIDESRLPEGSSVINLPDSMFRSHRETIIATLALLCLQLVVIVWLIYSVRQRRKSEAHLRENRRQLAVTLDAIGDAVLSTDRRGQVVRVNPAAAQLFGGNGMSLTGMSSSQLLKLENGLTGERLPDPCLNCIKAGIPLDFGEHTRLLVDRAPARYLSGNCAPIKDDKEGVIGTVLVCRDITEQHNLRLMLAQSQKMEAIGQLAGGVAHDFNNMLAGIMGFAEMLSVKLAGNPELQGSAEQIFKTTRRAADLVSKLLSFARKGKVFSSPIDCHETIEAALALLERGIDKRVELVKRLEATNATVIGDPTQLQNVFLNLGINASDAMQGGGKLTVSTSNIELGEPLTCEMGDVLMPGAYLRIGFADTGQGISDEIRQSIFEPFFTTKGPGKGTGLGLSAVYGAVREHSGGLTLDSRLGEGATFQLYLPSLRVSVAAVQPKEHQVSRGQEKTVLVIDDEAVVRSVTEELLGNVGFRVLTAAGGDEGLASYRERQKEIDVILLDLNMPRMDGETCLRLLREINADVRVVITSGFGRTYSGEELKKLGIRGFLQKPFTVSDLCTSIDQAML